MIVVVRITIVLIILIIVVILLGVPFSIYSFNVQPGAEDASFDQGVAFGVTGVDALCG